MTMFEGSRPETYRTLAAAIDAADWLRFAGGLLTGLFAAAVAIGLAWWQLRHRFRERADDRAREEEKRNQESRRERRRDEYQAVRGLLDSVEKIEYRLDREGPLAAAALGSLDIKACAENTELLARKEIGAVREPLKELATLLHGLCGPASQNGAPTSAGEEVACAFRQGRAVEALGFAVKRARAALEREWGAA